MDERLYRSTRDRVIAGVAGGLAERYGADVSVIRVGWALLAILSGGVLALVYILMAIIIPEAPAAAGPWAAGPGAAWPGAAGASGSGAPGMPAPASQGAGSWTTGWTPPGGATGQPATRPSGRNTSVVIGIGLMVLGAWFLLDNYLDIRIDWDLIWPVVVIGLGGLLIVGAARRGSRP